MLALIGLLALIQFWLIARLTDALIRWLPAGALSEIATAAAAIRLPALIIALLLYAFIGGSATAIHLGFAVTRRPLALLCLVMVAVSLLLSLLARGWLPHPAATSDWLVFLATGLIAEELWFRGSIYQLAEQVLPAEPGRLPWLVIGTSAALFGLSHLQYYGFRPSAPAFAQVAYTFVFGLSLGFTRAATGNIIAPILLHLFSNLARGAF